jgi:hypothetical protein
MKSSNRIQRHAGKKAAVRQSRKITEIAAKKPGVDEARNRDPRGKYFADSGGALTLIQLALLKILRANRTRFLLHETSIVRFLVGFGFIVDRATVQAELRSLERRPVPLTDESRPYLWKAAPPISESKKLCLKVATLPPKAQAAALAIVGALHHRVKSKTKDAPCQYPVLSVELHASANN